MTLWSADEPTLGDRAIQPQGWHGSGWRPRRHQDPNRQVLEPAKSELQHPGGRSIEPLHVVDGDDDRSGPGQRTQDRAHRCADCPDIGNSALQTTTKQGDVYGTLLWIGQVPEHLLVEPSQQVGESRERQLRLGLRRTRREHAIRASGRLLDPFVPQDGLADTGFAFQEQRNGPVLNSTHEIAQSGEFALAPDDDLGHRGSVQGRAPGEILAVGRSRRRSERFLPSGLFALPLDLAPD